MFNPPVPRGAIYAPKRYKQLLDFSGMVFERNGSPTDFDFVLEFSSKELIIGEFKVWGKPVPYGQRRAITSVLCAVHQQGLATLGFIARHDCPPDELIPAHDCQVTEVLCLANQQGWYCPGENRRVRELIDSWRIWHKAQR